MLHFNGPALAAEAIARLDAANWDDCEPDRATRLYQSAQAYATLALTAAVLATKWDMLPEEDMGAWGKALNPTATQR